MSDKREHDKMDVGGEDVNNGRMGNPTGRDNVQEQQTTLVAFYGAQEMGLTMPIEGNIPLLQVCSSIDCRVPSDKGKCGFGSRTSTRSGG